MERPDHRRIHELEYELGFRDDPPPSRAQSAATASAFLKDMWTDAPGAVIEYDPALWRPSYDPSNPFGRAALLRRR